MNKKYIFATDVDGTMLMDNGQVHPETLEAFKKAKDMGHIVVIATGRAITRTIPLLEKMPYANYFVCNNGAAVYDVDKKEAIILHGVNPQHYPIVKEFAERNNVVFKLHTDKDWIGEAEDNEEEIPTKLTKELDEKIRQHIKDFPDDDKLFNGQTITQLAIYGSADFCAFHYDEFKKMFSHDSSIFLTNSRYLDVNPKDRSKWEGLKELANKLDIPVTNIVTFGDSGNDYEMISGAGENGFALANSHRDLVAKIKPRIGSNNTNAIGVKVLEYIEK